MLQIASSHNETFKRLLSLTESKGLKKEGLYFLSGEKLIREFLTNPSLPVVYEVVTNNLEAITHDNSKIIHLTPELFAALDVVGTHFNLLVLEQPAIERIDADQLAAYQPKGIEVVLPSGDPGNLGALLRSCEAFGISKVILTQEAAQPFLPKCVKASAGSVLRIKLARAVGLASFPDTCIALDMHGKSLAEFVWPANGLLVVGEEGRGFLRPFPNRLSIPTESVQSLNVVVAASIALAHRAMAGNKILSPKT